METTVRLYRNANRKSRATGHSVRKTCYGTVKVHCTYCRAEIDTFTAAELENEADRICLEIAIADGHECADRAAYQVIADRGLQLRIGRIAAAASCSAVAAYGVLAMLVTACGI